MNQEEMKRLFAKSFTNDLYIISTFFNEPCELWSKISSNWINCKNLKKVEALCEKELEYEKKAEDGAEIDYIIILTSILNAIELYDEFEIRCKEEKRKLKFEENNSKSFFYMEKAILDVFKDFLWDWIEQYQIFKEQFDYEELEDINIIIEMLDFFSTKKFTTDSCVDSISALFFTLRNFFEKNLTLFNELDSNPEINEMESNLYGDIAYIIGINFFLIISLLNLISAIKDEGNKRDIAVFEKLLEEDDISKAIIKKSIEEKEGDLNFYYQNIEN